MTDNEDKAPEFDEVMSLARRWYYTEIRSIAEEAIKTVLTSKPAPKYDGSERREYLVEWIDETTDNHEYVIYTAKAWMVLAASDNCDAYEDETGDQAMKIDVGTRACFAMRADVGETR